MSNNHKTSDSSKSDDAGSKNPFTKNRTFQSQQACLLIGLLNIQYDIEYSKPLKSNTTSLAFIRVSRLIDSTGTITDVELITNQRINTLLENDRKMGASEKTIERRKRIYSILEHIHVLMDLVKTTEFEIITIADKTVLNEDKRVLEGVRFGDKVIGHQDVVEKGKTIHSLMMEKVWHLSGGKIGLLKKGDTEIMCILLNDSTSSYSRLKEALMKKKGTK